MKKYGGNIVCVLWVTIVCLLIGVNCSNLSKEARKVHRTMEVRLNSFHNELINALMEIDDIRENRGKCICPAPNTTVTDVNVGQPEQTNTNNKEEIGGHKFREYVERMTNGFEDEKIARKRFEKHIVDFVTDHINSQEHGVWTTWSVWNLCSVSCGVGLQRRTRTCTQSTHGPHGNPCVGDASEYRGCTTKACYEPGIWTTWSSYNACSVSCGMGLQRRTRTCTQPIPGPNGYSCIGDASEYEVCSIGACADGSWSVWGSWDSCSATCNGGMRNRHRSCDNPAPSLLGKTCMGNNVQTEICNNKHCPNPMVYFAVHTPNGKLTTTRRPVFTIVDSNHRGAYNMETAVFTAPVKGLYQFSVTFIQKSTLDIYCYLYHNSNVISYVGTESVNHWESASVSVYLYLNIGDTVDVRDCDNWQNVAKGYGSIFTGALIMPS